MSIGSFLTSLLPRRDTAARVSEEVALADMLLSLMVRSTALRTMSAAKRIAMNIIVPQMAALRLGTYERLADGSTGPRVKGTLHQHLNYGLYGEVTGYEFWSAFLTNLLHDNNSYARILRLDDGAKPALLQVVERNACVPTVAAGRKTFAIDGKTVGPESVFHVHVNATDGLVGRCYEDEVNCFTLAQEAEAFALRFYTNGGNVRRVWKLIAGGTPAQETAAQAFLNAAITGRLNQHMDVVIPSHVDKAQELPAPEPRAAQALEGRQHQTAEILRLYGIEGDKVDLEKLYQVVIVPLCENIEQAIALRLLSARERNAWKVQYVIDGRFRGSTLTQFQIAEKALFVASVNEVRQWFGWGSAGPEYDAIVQPHTASAGVNEQRQTIAAGGGSQE